VLQVAPVAGAAGAPPAAVDEAVAESYARLVEERGFLERVRDEATAELSTDELVERVRAGRPERTLLVEVTAEAPDPEAARSLAASTAEALVAHAGEVELEDGGGGLVLATPATAEPRPVAPSLVANLAAGVVLGIVVWIGFVALGRESPSARTRL
jgi:capsular polysaccharide biosynthesis protein